MTLAEIMEKGGVMMWPLLILSIIALGTIIERVWFWSRILLQEGQILNIIMEATARNWDEGEEIARDYRKHPLGQFLYSPLRLSNPDPEVFHLALEAAADDQLALMRKGDKVLEAVIALSPLLGLFGTVWGLIQSLLSIQISDPGVIRGVGESLISTAAGLLVAIISLTFYRLFQAFWSNQVRIFRKAGSRLEVIYRQRSIKSEDKPDPVNANLDTPETVDRVDS